MHLSWIRVAVESNSTINAMPNRLQSRISKRLKRQNERHEKQWFQRFRRYIYAASIPVSGHAVIFFESVTAIMEKQLNMTPACLLQFFELPPMCK